jgi:CheY-like chemotaxis protein
MRGSETILLVEDEEALRKLTRHFLVESGYTVLATNHPDKAVQIARHHGGPIHLLLTDVVMPGMNGYSLAENLATMRPAMRVVYMSGYTNFKQGALFPSKAFVLSKPFTEEALLRCVHEVLAFEAEPEAVTQPSM